MEERLDAEYYRPPSILKNAGFKNYQETNKVTARAKEDVIYFTKELMELKKGEQNLLVMGNTGTGKTHLCTAAARTLKEKGFTVVFLTSGQLLAKIKSTYQRESLKTSQEILNDIEKLNLLILDDVGSEATGSNGDWRKSMR
jgi:DNA replication protein DnaC